MAGLRGNQAYWGWAKQSVKGTAVPMTHRTPFSGGSIAPSRNVGQLSETDANRDQGISYVEQTSVEGSPEMYVRDSNIHALLDLALGSTASSGTPPDYTHVVTPANVLPYATLYRMLGATLFESFEDCMVNELTLSADTGGPLTATVGVMGRKAVRSATEWATPPALANSAVYNFNEATVTAHGGVTALISNFELSLNNNVTVQQTDDSIPYDVTPGVRELTVGYDMIFETLAAYNSFHYGGPTGTAQSNQITETALTFEFSKGVKNSIKFDIPHAAVEEFPVEPDPGGDPVVVSVRTRAQRHVTDPIVTATVKNQAATVLV